MKNLFNQKIRTRVIYYQDLYTVGAFSEIEEINTMLPLIIDIKTGSYALDLTEAVENSGFCTVDEYLVSDRFLDFLNDLEAQFGYNYFKLKKYRGKCLFSPPCFMFDNKHVKAYHKEELVSFYN